MVEQKQPEGVKSLTPTMKPTEPGRIIPPKEYLSKNGKIKVIIDGSDVTIDFAGMIAEDIGCYRNVKSVMVKFKEGQGPQIIPTV